MSSRQTKRSPKTPAAPLLERHSRPIALALVLLASARIVATYTVFNHTFDEPAHIACGMEWLDRGAYTYEPQHPPLARVAAALGPYFLGVRSQSAPQANDMLAVATEGARILYKGHQYDLTLALARLGILPFFWIACLVVYMWAKRTHGAAVAVGAVFLFSFLPPILAHAGLATTDMALTALLGAAFLTGWIWLERPTAANGAVFGLCTGLMVLSKFSSLAYFPAVAAVGLATWMVLRGRESGAGGQEPGGLRASFLARLPSFGLAVAVGTIVTAAAYRFSLGPLWSGIQAVISHNQQGHPSYLLGQTSASGFWYFYPVVLAVKTPLAFLILLGFARWRRDWLPLAFAAGILLVAFFSRINIGVRHILPVYLSFSVAAASALPGLLRRWRWAAAVLLLWFAGSSLWNHPDYLAYFNELAGSQPEKILVESDLDWGQDMKRLAARLQQAGARQVTFDPLVLADYEREHGFPPILQSNPAAPSPGWNAVSLTMWKARRTPVWPDRQPPGERVGRGVMLWFFR